MGFLPGLCVPHHDTVQSNGVPRLQDSDDMFLSHSDLQVSIGIDEAAALVVADGMVRVVADGDKAGCQVKRVGKDRTSIDRWIIRPSDGAIPMERMFGMDQR
jgi:DNA transposition AAA+ family ATPase